MSRLIWPVLALVAAVFAGGLVLEYEAAQSKEDALIDLARPRGGSAPGPARADVAEDVDGWVAAILARPLFSPTRRPPPGSPSGSSSKGRDLPRLTGVLVSEAGRFVIFAGRGDEKPTIAREGGHVGAFTVTSISPGQVTLAGPDGQRVLHPAFSNAPHPTDATQPPAPPPPMAAADLPSNTPDAGIKGLGIPGVVPFAGPSLSPSARGLTQ